MATNLFDQYYDNPTKSYIYSKLICNGPSADEISFDINGSSGVISDNVNTLSEIDLSDVHVPLSQYDHGMKTLEPYSFMYVRGSSSEMGFTQKVFKRIIKRILDIENWENHMRIYFTLKVIVNGFISKLDVDVTGTEDEPVIEQIQKIFDENELPITITREEDKIILRATVQGYDFWIESIVIDYTMLNLEDDENTDNEEVNEELEDVENEEVEEDSEDTDNEENINDCSCHCSCHHHHHHHEQICILVEDLYEYIPAIKYKNGGMKGCVVFAKYPVFNAENIPETQHSLRISHIRDRFIFNILLKDKIFNNCPIALRIINDVDDTKVSPIEKEIFNKWSNPTLKIKNNIVVPYDDDFWKDAYVGKIPNNIVGVYGYLNHVARTGLWEPMGQIYMKTAVDDDPTTGANNLLTSFIIYNPNSFPVVVKYMTFV